MSLKKYFVRRLTRLEPPYLLCLVLFFALKIAAARGTAVSLFPNLIASIFYVHNLVFQRPSDIEFVAWSLEIEVQFYILAPVLASVFAIANGSLRKSVLVVSVLATTALSTVVTNYAPLQLSLLAYAQYFLVGFLLTEFYLSATARDGKSRLWDLTSIAGWCLLLALLVVGGQAVRWVLPWLIVLLYIAAFQGVIVRRVITNPWITVIGGMCYSIYLLHNYAIAALGMVTEGISSAGPFAVRLLIQFLVMAPAILIISALYFRFIERPCMRPNWPTRLRALIWGYR